MTSISNEEFNKRLEEQKINAIKWRELDSGTIYTIIKAEYTLYGEACILTLGDKRRVFAPLALINRLKVESNKPFPRYVRPKCRVQSKRNPAQSYYAFELVYRSM